MLMPITVYPASESTVRYVDRASGNHEKAIGLHALYPWYVLESADGDGEPQYYLSLYPREETPPFKAVRNHAYPSSTSISSIEISELSRNRTCIIHEHVVSLQV